MNENLVPLLLTVPDFKTQACQLSCDILASDCGFGLLQVPNHILDELFSPQMTPYIVSPRTVVKDTRRIFTPFLSAVGRTFQHEPGVCWGFLAQNADHICIKPS